MAITILRPAAAAAAAALLLLGAALAANARTSTAAGASTADAYTAAAPAVPSQPQSPATPAAPATASSASSAETRPKAQPADPSVGALFADSSHFCSASVVHSTAGDVVLTAAHCVNGGSGAGNRTGLSFAPGYHDGVAPYGMWSVTGIVVADGWASSSDPDLDFAFLTVRQAGNPATVESLTGANVLGTDRGFVHRITLTGYPDTTDSPVVCQGTTNQSDTYQQRVACAGFPDGTSGGPWVTDVDTATGHGTVIGVIGGFQLGGDTPDVSYSAYFDGDIANLYDSVAG